MTTETAQPTTDAKIGEWQAFLSWPDGYITTDPDEQAEMFADARGEISIRRATALPDEDGKLPGTYTGTDLFVEIDLDMYDSEALPEVWELAQKAAAGMNQPAEVRNDAVGNLRCGHQYNPQGTWYQCELRTGHDGVHTHEGITWTNPSATVPAVPVATTADQDAPKEN